METATTPSQMQAQILSRFVKKDEAGPNIAKAIEKFGRTLEFPFGECIKDRLFHKIETELVDCKPAQFSSFVGASVPYGALVALNDKDDSIQSIFSYDNQFIAFLARALFGGDLEAEISTEPREPTLTERAMLVYFTGLLSKQLTTVTTVASASNSIIDTDEIEPADIPTHDAMVCQFRVSIEKIECRFSLILDVALADNSLSDDSVMPGMSHHHNKDDLMFSKVPASVRISASPQTLLQIRNLKPGDHIPLADIGSLVGKLVVKEREIYAGQIGRSGDSFSFRVTDALAPPN